MKINKDLWSNVFAKQSSKEAFVNNGNFADTRWKNMRQRKIFLL